MCSGWFRWPSIYRRDNSNNKKKMMLEISTFFTTWICLLTLVDAVTYNIEELCHPRPGSTNFLIRHLFPKRQFGSTLLLSSGEPVLLVLGRVPPAYATPDSRNSGTPNVHHHHPSAYKVLPSTRSSSSSSSNMTAIALPSEAARADLDCRFSIKCLREGANVTLLTKWWGMDSNCTNFLQFMHGPEMYLIRMAAEGNQAFTSSLYFSLHIRVSVCSHSFPHAGLILMASMPSAGDDAEGSSTTTLLAFLTPCLVLLLIVGSTALGCCCCADFSCQPHIPRARCRRVAREPSHANLPPAADDSGLSTDSDRDKPPTYEELFPISAVNMEMVELGRRTKSEELPPPSYENLRPERPSNQTLT